MSIIRSLQYKLDNQLKGDLNFSFRHNLKIMMFYSKLVIFLIIPMVLGTANIDPKQIQEKINFLNTRLIKHYWKKNQAYKFPGITNGNWEHLKGLYESRVHFNIVDKKNSNLTAFMRSNFFKIDDINMFVTSFVLFGLLEAKELGTIKINQHYFSQSLNAIVSFKDKNIPQGIPQYVFWPQVKINNTWAARASNIIHQLDIIPQPPKKYIKFLNKIGLGAWAYIDKIKGVFSIPADNDDSSVNLALLGIMKQTNSSHFQFWKSLHPKKQLYYQRALKYAYRPFGAKISQNKYGDEIDPRTYYILRQFIQMKKNSSENPSLILPTTWLIKLDEQVTDLLMMPFSSNNVDGSVSANFLFGLCYQVLGEQVKLNDQLTQMMMDTADLLQFTINKAIYKRPTLLLLYYPSKHDFYWFVARIVNLLKRHTSLPQPLIYVKNKLQATMKLKGTQQLIKQAIEDYETAHWAQFLGNYANKNRNQDAIFSSSMALNALLDCWTTRKGSNVIYDNDTPNEVKKIIRKGIKYLLNNVKPKMKQLNAFFSGSIKLEDNTFPYYFPSTLVVDGKGNVVDPTNPESRITLGTKVWVKGYIEPQKYQQMLKKKWFGQAVPEQEVDLNSELGPTFPFWSSRAITQVMAINCLSKFLKLSNEQDTNSKLQKEFIKVQ